MRSQASGATVSSLPTRLASGIEALSGFDMSGVRVHSGYIRSRAERLHGDTAALAADRGYVEAQRRSVHRGPDGAAWNSGNSDRTPAALGHLALPAATLDRFTGESITRAKDAFGAAVPETVVGRTLFGSQVTSCTVRWS